MSAVYDLAIVGTGFASTVFLHEYLRQSPLRRRVIVLERGDVVPHDWRVRNQRHGNVRDVDTYVNRSPQKPWNFHIGFGGSSARWWASTPRMLPADFEMQSRYGVGVDWPISYGELEPHYETAEDLLGVAGSASRSLWNRSRPYPLPPHRWSDVDRRLAERQPELFVPAPTARRSRPTGSGPACCASSICAICPSDSKFTVQNHLAGVYRDPRVELRLGSCVQEILHRGSSAVGLSYDSDARTRQLQAETIVLGANALFNPHILARSGLSHPHLGRHLVEQSSNHVTALLAGLENFGGSTSITGHGYHLYDGAHRRQRAALLMESRNDPFLRLEAGKWRQIARFKFIAESLPSPKNRVIFDPRRPSKPVVEFFGHSAHTHAAFAGLEQELPKVLAGLPIEHVDISAERMTSEGHILGTARMADDAKLGIVDRHQVHHRLRNLLVLGGSSFPSCAPANPTLTICALSSWSAANYLGVARP